MYHLTLVAGDTHFKTDMFHLRQLALQAEKFQHKYGVSPLNKDDIVIIAGDVSVLFYPKQTPMESQLIGEYNKIFPWTTVFPDGNHENFARLNALARRQWCGGEVGVIANKLMHLRRSQIFTINGKTFFILGGANSMDKGFRTPGITWWSEELVNKREKDQALAVLEGADWKVDYVITHAGPYTPIRNTFSDFIQTTNPKSRYYDPVEFFLDKIYDRLDFKHWYCGHYHNDKRIGDLTVIYQDLIDIDTGKALLVYEDEWIEKYLHNVAQKKGLL